MSLTTSLTRILPWRRRSPIAISSSTATELLSTACSILRSPSSMRLAISTSPSRVSSETEPILRRYMRTGSLVRELGAARARAIDDLDAVLAERGQPAVDLIGRDHVLGHVVVDLVVGHEA